MMKIQEALYWEMLDKISNWQEEGTYPEIDCNKFVDFDKEFPCFQMAKSSVKTEQTIRLSDIWGSNWAFQKKEDRGRYPSTTKLKWLLSGYTNFQNESWRSPIPPVPVYRVLGGYYLDEGNHRLYLSKLLGRETILADVYEFDYEELLLGSKLLQYGDNFHMVIPDHSIYPVSKEEAKNFERYKKLIEEVGKRGYQR